MNCNSSQYNKLIWQTMTMTQQQTTKKANFLEKRGNTPTQHTNSSDLLNSHKNPKHSEKKLKSSQQWKIIMPAWHLTQRLIFLTPIPTFSCKFYLLIFVVNWRVSYLLLDQLLFNGWTINLRMFFAVIFNTFCLLQ